MATVDFRDLLSFKGSDVKKPKIPPIGTYTGVITHREMGVSKQKGTPYAKFTYSQLDFGDDIADEDREGVNLSKRSFNSSFYFTEDSLWRIVEFAKSCGISVDRDANEWIEEFLGSPVVIEIEHRPGRTPDDEPSFQVKSVKGV
jgi:hypothetical protein